MPLQAPQQAIARAEKTAQSQRLTTRAARVRRDSRFSGKSSTLMSPSKELGITGARALRATRWIKERADHVKAQGQSEDLKAARQASVAGSTASAGLEESHWLCPIEDQRGLDSAHERMVEGL